MAQTLIPAGQEMWDVVNKVKKVAQDVQEGGQFFSSDWVPYTGQDQQQAPPPQPTPPSPAPAPQPVPPPPGGGGGADDLWQQFQQQNPGRDWARYVPIPHPSLVSQFQDIQDPGSGTLYGLPISIPSTTGAPVTPPSPFGTQPISVGVDSTISSELIGGGFEFADIEVPDFSTYFTQLQTDYDKTRAELDRYRTDYMNQVQSLADFQTQELERLRTEAGIEDIEGQLEGIRQTVADIDTDINSGNQRIEAAQTKWDQTFNNIQNQPLSLSQITGQNAHAQRMAAVEMNSLVGQQEMLIAQKANTLGQYEMAQNAYDKANELIRQSVFDQIELRELELSAMSDFIDDISDELDTTQKQQASLIQMGLDMEMFIEEERIRLIGELWREVPEAGITMSDSLEEAGRKAVPYLVTDPSDSKGVVVEGRLVNPFTGEVIYESPEDVDLAEEMELAKAVLDGTITLKDLTPTQRTAIAPILNSEGYKSAISVEMKQDIESISKGLDDTLRLLEDVSGVYKGKVQGWISEKLGAEDWNEKVAAFNSSAKIVGMQLTRLFEKGRISDQDRLFYLSLMPNLQQNKAAAEASVRELKNRLNSKIGEYLGELEFEGEITEEEFNILRQQFPDLTDQELLELDFSRVGGDTNIATGMRTDRHNNPTALMWTPGVENFFRSKGYNVAKGDKFPDSANYTLDMSGVSDPVEATIDYIDEYSFYLNGQPRWTHTAIPKSEWNRMSTNEKKRVVKDMYRKEGNQGVLNQFFV